LNPTLISLPRRVTLCEEKIAIAPDSEEHVVDSDDITIKMLLDAMMQNSHRIDDFDGQVCSIRVECENMTSAIESAHHVSQQSGHGLFDFSGEFQ
jgi:hypothetical protein